MDAHPRISVVIKKKMVPQLEVLKALAATLHSSSVTVTVVGEPGDFSFFSSSSLPWAMIP